MFNEIFQRHESSNDEKFEVLFRKLDENKCPHDKTIPLLESYNKKQNGHIENIDNHVGQCQVKLDAIISGTIGEEKAKKELIAELKRAEELKKNNRNFVLAIITCMFVGIGTFAGFFYWYKQPTVDDKMIVKIISAYEKGVNR